jgi:hypothetical protein
MPWLAPRPPVPGFDGGTFLGRPGYDNLPGLGMWGGGMSGDRILDHITFPAQPFGGDPMGPGPPIRISGPTNLRFKPEGSGWRPPGLPPEVKWPPINQQTPPPLNQKLDVFPFSHSSEKQSPKDQSSEWPTWVAWETAFGLFALCVVIGIIYGRYGPIA